MGRKDSAGSDKQKPSSSDRLTLPGSSGKIDGAPASAVPSALSCGHRREILAAYESVLEVHSGSMRPASSLPYPKEVIRRAIIEELADTVDSEDPTGLELSYSQLEVFLDSGEYELVEKFATVKSVVERLARSGNPHDLLVAGELIRKFPGDRVVEIFQCVSKQMRNRVAELRRLFTQGTA